MRTRQRRKRKGEGEKEEDEEERNSEEEVPTSLLQQLGERVSHKHFGKHLLSVANLDGFDVALFVVAAAAIKKSIKKWKESQLPAKTEEDSGEQGEEAHVQHSPRGRRQSAVGRRRKAPRSAHTAFSARPETATLLASASSIKKGETLEDTIRMLAAYADAIVLRHPEQGSAARAAAVLDTRTDAAEVCCLVNGGDGTGEHPTQALLDLFTIAELFPEWWNEQLQRLTKDQHAEDLPGEKDKNEEPDAMKKENRGGETQQEREGEAMDSRPQQQTVSYTTEEGAAGGGGHQSPGLFQKMEERERAAEGTAAAPPAVVQSSSSSSQDVSARDTSATDAEKKPREPRKLTVAFVGDLKHGRTVHSLALLLSKFNCRIITLSLSDLVLPAAVEDIVRSNFAAQRKRKRNLPYQGMEVILLWPSRIVHKLQEKLVRSFLVQVLHPLPRLDEIDPTVDTTPFCAYFTQAENGVYMRMALLAIVLNPYTWHLLFGV